jgi:hypothetical protein
MRFSFHLSSVLLAAIIAAAGGSQALPLAVGAGGGVLTPVGGFGRDLGGSLNLSIGFGVLPVEKVRLAVEASYARLRGKGDNDLSLDVAGAEVSARYIFYSFTDDVRLYSLLGIGNSRMIRTLGSGEERGYQVNGVIGGGGSFRVHQRALVDAGLRLRRYFSDKSGDAFLLQVGVWYG